MPESFIKGLFRGRSGSENRGGSEDEQPPVNPDQPQNQESVDQPATSTTAESATGMPEVSSLEPKDPSISLVLNQIARMLESGDLPDGVNRDAIATTTRTLMALDGRIFDVNNQLKEKSPLKALVAAAESMSGEGKDLILNHVELLKKQINESIQKIHEDSLVKGDTPLSFAQARERFIAIRAENDNLASLGAQEAITLHSLDDLNDLLKGILGTSFEVLERNDLVSGGQTKTSVESKIIPGLKVDIYDRVKLKQHSLQEGETAFIHVYLSVRGNAEAVIAAIQEATEGMDNN